MVQAAKTLGQGPTFPIMQLSRIVFFFVMLLAEPQKT